MARKADETRLDDIREAIIRNPGHRPARIARMLGLDNKAMQRALLLLEARGDLLAEDDEGRLVWLGRHGR